MTKMPRRILLSLALAAFSLCPLCLSGCSGNGSDNAASLSHEETQGISSLELAPESSDNIQSPQKPTRAAGTAEYTYITPYTVNNPQLIPIPQILLDYENWFNSKEYQDADNTSPYAYWKGVTDDERKSDFDMRNKRYMQMNIMACVQDEIDSMSNPFNEKIFDDMTIYNRKKYVALVDYWLNDGYSDSKYAWSGNRHVDFYVGTDPEGNEHVYMFYQSHDYYYGLLFDNTLVSPGYSTREYTKKGFNLRNANHLRIEGKRPDIQDSKKVSEYSQIIQDLDQSSGDGEYTYVTPFMVNNSKLVPIPQVLLDYENQLNFKDNGIYNQVNIMACALISEEDMHELIGGYNDSNAKNFSDRHIYLSLIDYWLNEEQADSDILWEGNRHEIIFTGTDSSGNEVVYNVYCPEHRGSLIFNNALVAPDDFIRKITKLGFNLRNSDHIRSAAAE